MPWIYIRMAQSKQQITTNKAKIANGENEGRNMVKHTYRNEINIVSAKAMKNGLASMTQYKCNNHAVRLSATSAWQHRASAFDQSDLIWP